MVNVIEMETCFSLDVEAAERFLSCVPLLSLEEVPLARFFAADAASLLLRQESDGSCSAGVLPDRQESERSTGDRRAGIKLDVHIAQRFLRSLELGSSANNGNVPDVRVASKPIQAVAGSGAAPGNGSMMQANALDTFESVHTVIGGWRNRSDLDRLTPGLMKKGLIGGRVIISSQECATYVCSTRPWAAGTGSTGVAGRQDVLKVIGRSGRAGGAGARGAFGGVATWRPFAGFRLCRRSSTDQAPSTSFSSYLVPSSGELYDPDFLDDQSLRQGKHHTVLQLESYQVSVIPFVRPRRLKEELNNQFRCRHPEIHPSITLSKLRNLQKDLREITVTVPQLDASTVAMAWVYFEKLVLGDHVRKGNRKLLAGACLVLAFKFNQHDQRAVMRDLACCIRKLDRKDQLDLEALRDAELQVFVWLQFGLHLRRDAVLPHLHRTLKDMGQTLDEYYGTAGQCFRGLFAEDMGETEAIMMSS